MEVGISAVVEFDPSWGTQNKLTVTEGDEVEVRKEKR